MLTEIPEQKVQSPHVFPHSSTSTVSHITNSLF